MIYNYYTSKVQKKEVIEALCKSDELYKRFPFSISYKVINPLQNFYFFFKNYLIIILQIHFPYIIFSLKYIFF